MDTSKIIRGVVSNGRYTVTAPIVKEDYGLYLQIEGVELPETYQVDFSNSENSGTSVTMIGNSDGVLIPRQFIDTGKDIFAFLYHVGADFGRTVYKFRIPNKVRPDRTNEEPTPEEQSVIDQAISALNTAVAQTAQDVVDAEASAQAAGYDADRAEEARSASLDYAEQAEASAISAEQSATASANSASASANSASQSAQIKADVEDLADDAQGYAESALIASQASVTARDTAQGYAQSASASAQSASTSASNASTSAQTASTKATEASTSAQTASQKATEASQSATNASQSAQTAEQAKTASQTAQWFAESARDSAVSAKADAESAKADAESARDEAQQAVASISGALDDKADIITDTASGSIASFSDGADDLPLKSLVVNIDPVQDLHGQDSPYPAGGGKNLLIQMPQKTSVINGVTWTINSDGSISANGTASGNSTFNYIRPDDTTDIVFDGDYKYIQFPFVPITVMSIGVKITSWYSVYSQYVSSINGASGKIDTMWFQIKDGQTANVTFYPMIYSASETQPTSWSPYSNICPISGWTGMQFQKTGVNIWNGTLGNDVFVPFPTKVGVQYSVSAKMVDSTQNTYLYVKKRTVGDTSTGTIFKYIITGKTVTPQAFTAEAGYEYGLWSNGKYTNVTDVQIEIGSSATAYEPYTGRSITIDLGQTVYGGKLDVLSGVLTVDMAMIKPTSVYSITQHSSGVYYCIVNNNLIPMGANKSGYFLVSDMFKKGYLNDGECYLTANGTYLMAVLPREITTKTDANVWMEANQPTFVYELAEPLTIQLTPNQVNSLLGVNNLWADSGDTEVVYRADTKAWIQRKIAEAIASLT